MNLQYEPDFTTDSSELSEVESHHLISVLRKEVGDRVYVTNGKGMFFTSVIESIIKRTCKVKVESSRMIPFSERPITLCISLLKTSERMEWLVEKATEIGVHSIKFFVATRTERKNLNTEKLRNISISAIKQSGRCWLPELSEPLPIRDILKIDLPEKFIASFSDKNQVNSLQLKDSKPCCIMVGPEGDFTEDELNQAFQCGFKSVKLSNFTLRSETAGLIAVHELLRSN